MYHADNTYPILTCSLNVCQLCKGRTYHIIINTKYLLFACISLSNVKRKVIKATKNKNTNIYWGLMCARYFSKHKACFNSFNFYSNLLYRRQNRGTERLHHLPKFTEQVNGRVKVWTPKSGSSAWASIIFIWHSTWKHSTSYMFHCTF